jgi:hypothetical protein
MTSKASVVSASGLVGVAQLCHLLRCHRLHGRSLWTMCHICHQWERVHERLPCWDVRITDYPKYKKIGI